MGFHSEWSTGIHLDIFCPCLKMLGSLSSVLGVLPNSVNSETPRMGI